MDSIGLCVYYTTVDNDPIEAKLYRYICKTYVDTIMQCLYSTNSIGLCVFIILQLTMILEGSYSIKYMSIQYYSVTIK